MRKISQSRMGRKDSGWVRFQHAQLTQVLLIILVLSLMVTGCEKKSVSESTELIINTEQTSKTNYVVPSVTNIIRETDPPVLVDGDEIALFTRLSKEQPDLCENPLAAWVDLDLGVDGLGHVESADLVFTCSKGSMIYYVLSPANGASYKIFYTEGISFDDCAQDSEMFTKRSIPDFPAGPICILTDEGRLAMVQYVPDSWHSGYGGEASILLRITVWDQVLDIKR